VGRRGCTGTIFVLATTLDNAPDGCSVVGTPALGDEKLFVSGRYRISDQRGLTARFKTSPVEQVREYLGLLNGIVDSVMSVLAL
jgi:hypothetical protein